MKNWILLPLVMIALAAPAQVAPPAREEWIIDRHEWSRELSAATRVTVRNLHGDVRVRPSGTTEVFLLGLIQHHADDGRLPSFDILEESSDLTLVVTYPGGTESATTPPAWAKRRIDVTVLVPAAAAVSVETAGGLAEIKGVMGDLTVRTTFGEIVTATSGTVDAESVHGPIRSELRTFDWTAPPRFTTINGDIRVQLPRTVMASARLETHGEIATDFSLAVTRDPATGHKVAWAEIGGGGTQITATSTNGNIKLLQSITGY